MTGTSSMGKRKVPLRKCTVCGEMKPKKELLRVLHTPENLVLVDSTGKQNGRGAYVCKDVTCISKAKKSKVLERSLGIAIPDVVYEALLEEGKKIDE